MVLAVSIRFDFVDNKAKTSFTKVRVPTGFEISHYSEFAVGLSQLFANISTGRITRVSFCVGLDLSGSIIKAIASGLSDVSQKALFGFSTVISGFRTKSKLPAISETKVIAGSDALDLGDADVAAFVSAMETGIVVTAGTVQPVDTRDNDVESLDFAHELFRKT